MSPKPSSEWPNPLPYQRKEPLPGHLQDATTSPAAEAILHCPPQQTNRLGPIRADEYRLVALEKAATALLPGNHGLRVQPRTDSQG